MNPKLRESLILNRLLNSPDPERILRGFKITPAEIEEVRKNIKDSKPSNKPYAE